MPTPGIWHAGSHGFELTGPDGTYHQNESAAAAVPLLERAASELLDSLAEIPGVRVEHKRFAVAVHYREVAPEHIGEVVATTRRLGQRVGLRVTSGRKVIELRPDIDWDKGSTLAWIRGRIDTAGSMLPIYIGDDLTDEDAFDAVRFDGIGIAVRHSEDGDRRSAAQFTLESPDEVREFVQRGSNWLAYKHQTVSTAWDFTFEGYEPQSEKLREALCTVGNGYFATRGAAPESKAGQVHYPGTYAAGVYNRLVDERVGYDHRQREPGEPPQLASPHLPRQRRQLVRHRRGHRAVLPADLDLRSATLTREFRFRDEAGQHQFGDATAIRRDADAPRRCTSDNDRRRGLVGDHRDSLDAWTATSRIAGRALPELGQATISDRWKSGKSRSNPVLVTVQTTQSRIPVAMAARSTVWRDETPVPATYRLIDEQAEIGHDIAVELSAGESVTVEKIVTVFTGRDVAMSEPAAEAERWLSRLGRFAELRAGHVNSWMHLWERLSIEFDDFTDELRILRLHLLHLLQTVSPNTGDLDVGVPARGLHGEAYRGHIFWDELFIFPLLNLRMPAITRSLLLYRYRRLPEARQAATEAGYRGAMFPWQCGSDGREESQRLHLNPRSRADGTPTRAPMPTTSASPWRITRGSSTRSPGTSRTDDYGAEMLVEIARFWASRASYDQERGRYSILGVIGA